MKLRKTGDDLTDTNDFVVDLQGLSEGIYFLQVFQGETALRKKLIKL